jgi:hypothetical protein
LPDFAIQLTDMIRAAIMSLSLERANDMMVMA